MEDSNRIKKIINNIEKEHDGHALISEVLYRITNVDKIETMESIIKLERSKEIFSPGPNRLKVTK